MATFDDLQDPFKDFFGKYHPDQCIHILRSLKRMAMGCPYNDDHEDRYDQVVFVQDSIELFQALLKRSANPPFCQDPNDDRSKDQKSDRSPQMAE